MIDLQIQTDMLTELPKRAREFVRLTRGELLQGVAELTVLQAKKRIKTTHHTPDLQRWAPRKHEYRHPMLRKSGTLLRSIRRQRRGAGEYDSGVQGSFAARVSAYAVYQQYGTRRGIEPRAYIGVGNQDAREIEDLIKTFVELRF